MLSQTFGIEIECYLPAGMTHAVIARKLTEAGVETAAEGYNHNLRTHWKVVTDGSLGDYTRGAEIVSPVLTGEAGLAAIRKVCDVLVAEGVTVNRQCGLHVHVGARNRSVDWFQALIISYAHFEEVIDGVLPRSRRADNNSFCRSMRPFVEAVKRATDIYGVCRAVANNQGPYARYRKLNCESFARHGTVEFRQHSGTIEADKAVNWVLLCLSLCHKAAETARPMVAPAPVAAPAAVAAEPQPIVYRGRQVTRTNWPEAWSMLQLMRRPQGASLEELQADSGMRRPMPALRCRLFGYEHREVNGRHFAINPLANVAAPVAQAQPAPVAVAPVALPDATLAGLVAHARLGKPVAAYFEARAAHFAARAAIRAAA